jgi:hypothetical protein
MADESGAAERVFFERGPVRVTKSRFQVGAQTYAMAAVNSVSYSLKKEMNTLILSIAIVGALVLLSLMDKFVPVGGLVCLLGIPALAYWVHRSQTTKGTVVLTTSSGQIQALEDADSAYITAVVEALNNALVARG